MTFIKVGAVIAALVLGWSAVRAQPSTVPTSPSSTTASAPGANGSMQGMDGFAGQGGG